MAAATEQLQLDDWQALRFNVLRVYDGPPGLPHEEGGRAGSLQAWLLRKGTVVVTTRTATVRAHQGQWMMTSSEKLKHDFSDDALILSATLRAHWPDDRLLFRHDPPVVLEAAEHPRLEKAAQAVLVLMPPPAPTQRWGVPAMTTSSDLDSYVRYRRRVQRLFEAYVGAMQHAGVTMNLPGGTDARVLEVIRRIEHQPRRATFSQARLARDVGLSESQLHRLFVRETGVTPFQYFDERRCEYAERMLRTSDMPIKSLAFTLGFTHPSYFTNWFVKRHNMSPRDFRKLGQRTKRSLGAPRRRPCQIGERPAL